jgi:hypothetical protein
MMWQARDQQIGTPRPLRNRYKASLRPNCSSLRNAFDRARLQTAGDRQSAFSYEPDNIRWPCAACTEGIRHGQTSGVCACGSWLLVLVLRQAERQPRLACFSLLRTDSMNDRLRRFLRKVIAGFAQAFANVPGNRLFWRVTLLGISSLRSNHMTEALTPPT